MAIAFDAATQAGGAQVNNTQSWSHSAGALTDGVAIVCVQFQSGRSVSGTPTYDGVAMTLLTSYLFGGTTFDNTYIYYRALGNTTAGSKTVSVTATAKAYVYTTCETFSGVDQTNPTGAAPTFNTGSTTGTSFSLSLTTTDDNAWLVGMGQAQGVLISAGTNTVRRATSYGGYAWHIVIDTNSAQTPVGSKSMTITTASSVKLGIIMAQIIPTGGGVGTPTANANFFGGGI